MDEKLKQLLQDYVSTANSGKYKTMDEVHSKFPELKDYSIDLLNDYVATANSGKYSSIDEVNARFPEFGPKQAEVSPQGSGLTSKELGEPTTNTNNLNQNLGLQGQNIQNMNGNSLDQSLLAQNNATNLNDVIAPEGTEIVEGVYNEYGLPVYANRQEDGTYTQGGSFLEPVELKANRSQAMAQNQRIAAQDLSTWESAKNSFKNMYKQLEGFDKRLTIMSADIYKKVLGKDLAKSFYELSDRDIDQEIATAYQQLDAINESMNPTLGFTDGDALAGVVNATTSFASTALSSMATMGAGLVTEMVGGSLYDYNKEKAKSLGVSVEDLYKQGKEDFWTPAAVGTAGFALERIGLKGATKAIMMNISGKTARQFAVMGWEMNKEGATEWIQTGLSAYNEAIAQGKSQADALADLGYAMGSKEGLESYLQGLAGSAVSTAGGRAAKGFIDKTKGKKVADNNSKIQSLLVDYANTDDPNIKETLLDTAVELIEGNSQLEAENVTEIESVPQNVRAEVVSSQMEIDSLNEAVETGNVSDSSKAAIEAKVQDLESNKEAIIKENTVGTTVKDALSKPDGRYILDGEDGTISVDEGGKVSFETESKVVELGNVESVSDNDLSSFGIDVEREIPVSIDGNKITLDGVEYVNNFSDPSSAINRDSDGRVVSINLETPDGKKRTIRGQRADAIAYEYQNLQNENTETEIQSDIIQEDSVVPVESSSEQETVAAQELVEPNVEINETIQETNPEAEVVSTEVESENQNVAIEPEQVSGDLLKPSPLQNPTKDPYFIEKRKQGKIIVDSAIKSGREDLILKVMDMAYEGRTASSIAKETGFEEKHVREIRYYLGIPSNGNGVGMAIAGSKSEIDLEEKKEFESWKEYYAKERGLNNSSNVNETNLENEVESNEVQENTIQENEQTEVRAEVEQESTESTEMPDREQTNPRLKSVLKSIPNQDIDSLIGPANVEKRRDVIEAITGKRPAKNDAGINATRKAVDDYFGLTGDNASKASKLRNWANYEQTEFSNEQEAGIYQIRNTEDPNEILDVYDSDVDNLDYKESAISDYVGKINVRDYGRYGDLNKLQGDRRLQRWIDSKNSQTVGIDVMAEELSDQLGVEVTPQDFIDFIENYSSAQDFRDANKSNVKIEAENRYKELTGRNITENALEKRRAARNTESSNSRREAVNRENMAAIGVTDTEVADRQNMESEQEKVAVKKSQSTKTSLPKSLMQGVVDRLKKTGLAKSVKVMSSADITKDLPSRIGISFEKEFSDDVNFQLNFGLFSKGDLKTNLLGKPVGIKKSVLDEIKKERESIIARAKRNGTYLKAPNGSHTNLSPSEWTTVRTKRFKDWFGDWERNPKSSSKIIDENGEPLVYYNGSKTGFDSYDKKYFYTGEGAMYYGAGFYFTPSRTTAESYARQSVLGDYRSRANSISKMVDTSKMEKSLSNIPNINRGNISEVNSKIKTFLSEMDSVISDLDKKSKSVKNVDEKTVLSDLSKMMKDAKSELLSDVRSISGGNISEGESISTRFGSIMSTAMLKSNTSIAKSEIYGVGDGVVKSLFLNARNPLHWEGRSTSGLIDKVNRELVKINKPRLRGELKTNGDVYRSVAESLGEPIAPSGDVRQYTKTSEFFNDKVGIDSVAHVTTVDWSRGQYFHQSAGEAQIIVFEPNQIKDTGNNGTFSSDVNNMNFQMSGESINGYVDKDGNIVINEETASLDTPVHEFAHIWSDVMKTSNPGLYNQGIDLIKSSEGDDYVLHVMETQPHLQGEAIYEEALVQAIGDSGARLIETQERSKIKEWLQAAWDYIGGLVGISGKTPEQIANMSLREYTDAVAIDLLSGKPIQTSPTGDIYVRMDKESVGGKKTSPEPVTKASDMNVDQKKISAFMEKMRLRNTVKYQGTVDPSSLSDSDLVEFVDVAQSLMNLGQVQSYGDLKDFASSLGIQNESQIKFVWNSVNQKKVLGIKKSLVDPKKVLETKYDKLSDAEYLEMGKQMVDSGLIVPSELLSDVLTTGRVLEPYEVTALIYGRTLDQQRIDELGVMIKSLQGEDLSNARVELESLFDKIRDYETMMLMTATAQSAAFRLRSVLTDKEYNVQKYIADMEAMGEISPDVRAELEALGREMESVKSELRNKVAELEDLKKKQSQTNINKAAKKKPTPSPKPRNTAKKNEYTKDALDIIAGLNVADYGLPGVSFQMNGNVKFSINSSNPLIDAIQDALRGIEASVSSKNLRLDDAIEEGITLINSKVGKGNWNEIKFRSDILNQYVDKGHVVAAKRPYVGTDGKLVVPTAYLKEIVADYQSNNSGEMSIEDMVDVVMDEVGSGFNRREALEAISRFGVVSGNTRSQEMANIQRARTIGSLLAELEDLEKGIPRRLKKKGGAKNDRAEEIRKQIRDIEEAMLMTPEERAQMRQDKALEAKKRYIKEYIDKIDNKIANKDFEPEVKTPLYDFSNHPDVIELEKKREDIKNKFKAAKFKHKLENREPLEKLGDLATDVLFNTTRALAAGTDISSFLVQGGLVTFSNPVASAKSLKRSMGVVKSEDSFDAYFSELQRDPLFESARKAKLNMQLPNFYQSVVEEQIPGGQNLVTRGYDALVDKFVSNKDVAKKLKDWFPMTAAERQYAVFLSDIRFNMFKQTAMDAINYQGVNPSTKEGQLKLAQIADAVNNMTMAANITTLEGATKIQKGLNLVLFSARKLAATFKLLYNIPYYGVRKSQNIIGRLTGNSGLTNKTEFDSLIFDKVYSQAAKGLGAMAATVIIPTLLANWSYDEDEDEEPPLLYNPYVLNTIHPDFLKLKIGDTRYSPFLGMEGNIGLIARWVSGKYMTSSSSQVLNTGEKSPTGMGDNKSRMDLLGQFLKNKLAPTPSIAISYFGNSRERREAGDKFAESFAPMWATGIYEDITENKKPLPEALGLGALGILGMSFNTYGGAEYASAKGTNNKEAYNIMRKVGISDYIPDARDKKSGMYDNGSYVNELNNKKFKKEYVPAYNDFMTKATIANGSKFMGDKLSIDSKDGLLLQMKKEAYNYAELKSTGVIVDSYFNTFNHTDDEGVSTKYKITRDQYPEKAAMIKEILGGKDDDYLIDSYVKQDIRDEVIAKMDKDGLKRDKDFINMQVEIQLFRLANRYANEKLAENFKPGKYIPSQSYNPDIHEEEKFRD